MKQSTLSPKNKIVIACAGSRKTSNLVKDVVAQDPSKRILVTTFTRENLSQIHTFICEKVNFIPSNIKIETWYSFLLRECVKPYQNQFFPDIKIKSIDYRSTRPARIAKTSKSYFVNKNNYIYHDFLSDFAFIVNEKTNNLVIKRLEKMYDQIYIDEVQDMEGWDYNLISKLLQSKISVSMVGDPRQTTYKTTNAPKKNELMKWINTETVEGRLKLVESIECYRCNQQICDYADSLYPELPKTISKCNQITGHDSVFVIHHEDIEYYINGFKEKPVFLRWDKRVNLPLGIKTMNMGLSKGRTFDRTIIFPTKVMEEYVLGYKDSLAKMTRAKLYVALTRAKFSTAIVINEPTLQGKGAVQIEHFVQNLPRQPQLFDYGLM